MFYIKKIWLYPKSPTTYLTATFALAPRFAGSHCLF